MYYAPHMLNLYVYYLYYYKYVHVHVYNSDVLVHELYILVCACHRILTHMHTLCTKPPPCLVGRSVLFR